MKAKTIIAILLAGIIIASGCTQEKPPEQQGNSGDAPIMNEVDSGWEDSAQNTNIGSMIPDDATAQDSEAGLIDQEVGSGWVEETDSVNIGEMY